MYTANSQKRVGEILDFITEIALGNYTYTLPLRNVKDELEQIVLSLNTMVEEIDASVHQINNEKSKEVIESVVFNMDDKLDIISYSENVPEILGYSQDKLIHNSLKSLVSESTTFYSQIDELRFKPSNQLELYNVDLKHANGYLWSGQGILHHLVSGGEKIYTLTIFKFAYYNENINGFRGTSSRRINRYPSENRSLLLQDQRILIRKLHKYVMDRLDRKLMTLPVISREVGGSVSKIKTLFKRTYGETIYVYHLRKRLEKAYILVFETNLAINEIAEDCGFKSFSHFCRSFKKQYHFTPSQVRKL